MVTGEINQKHIVHEFKIFQIFGLRPSSGFEKLFLQLSGIHPEEQIRCVFDDI